MLSDDMIVKLTEKVNAWVAVESVPRMVADRVLDIAKTEPPAERDVRRYCEENMLSTALVEWYNKFCDFLAQQDAQSEENENPAKFPGDVIDTAKRFRDALNIFLEQYDVR